MKRRERESKRGEEEVERRERKKEDMPNFTPVSQTLYKKKEGFKCVPPLICPIRQMRSDHPMYTLLKQIREAWLAPYIKD